MAAFSVPYQSLGNRIMAQRRSLDLDRVKNIVEAVLLASDRPLDVNELTRLFTDPPEQGALTTQGSEGAFGVDRGAIKTVLSSLQQEAALRCVALEETASGFRYRIRAEYATYIQRLWAERPPRYSRALLETLAIIAYRQPVTRGEIEEIRGVSVASSLLRTLRERDWIRVLGHRDVPGRPAMYGTTRMFLDHFGLRTLEEMPSLREIRDMEPITEPAADAGADADAGAEPVADTETDASEGPTQEAKH